MSDKLLHVAGISFSSIAEASVAVDMAAVALLETPYLMEAAAILDTSSVLYLFWGEASDDSVSLSHSLW